MALGFLALGAQNLVDFSLELPGVACVAAVALGTLLAKETVQASAPLITRPSLRLLCTTSCVVAGLAIAAATPLLLGASRASVHDRLRAALDDPELFARELGIALRYYPLDPNVSLLAATQAIRAAAPSAPRWLNIAMTSAPDWASPHVQAAYYLESRGALSQAAIEIRLALERDPSVEVRELAVTFLHRHPTTQLAFEVMPEASQERLSISNTVIDGLFGYAPRGETETFLRHVLSVFPTSAYVHHKYVLVALENGDTELAMERVEAMLKACATSPLSTATLIKVLVKSQQAPRALAVYNSASAKIRADHVVLLEALVAAGAASSSAQVAAITDELFAHYGSTSAQRARVHSDASLQFENAGDLAQALSHAQQSYEGTNDMDALERVHHIAQRAGIVQVALRAAAEMCHVGHRREAYCQRGSPP
jgi:hypothetical protein